MCVEFSYLYGVNLFVFNILDFVFVVVEEFEVVYIGFFVFVLLWGFFFCKSFGVFSVFYEVLFFYN